MPGVANGDSMSVDDMRVTMVLLAPPRRGAPHPTALCFVETTLLLLLLLRGDNAEADEEHERQDDRDAEPEETKAGGANAPAGEAWSVATAAAVATHRPTKLWLLMVKWV